MGIIDTVYPDGSPVQKANVRADDKTGHRRTMASVDAVRSADLTGQFGGIYVRSIKKFYDIGTEDLSEDDGDNVIIDFAGNHFVKLNLGSGGGDASDITNDSGVDGDTVKDALNTLDATVREKLSANRTYYVRADGSDSNNGLANTFGGAFLTIPQAINTILKLDLGGFNVAIQVGAGTYTGAVSVSVPFLGGIVTLQGDTTTPSNVVLSTTGASISVSNNASLNVAGFKLVSTADGLFSTLGGSIVISGNMEFGACSFAHLHANYGGAITINANYSITGGGTIHYWAETGGSINSVNKTIILTGTPAFSSAFARADIVAQIVSTLNTWTGAATGVKYNASNNAAIATFGSGASYFPGTASSGTIGTGGQYS